MLGASVSLVANAISTPVPHFAYRRREPENTVLHRVMLEHLSTFFAMAEDRAGAGSARLGLPRHVRRELAGFQDCGILSRGFVRVACGTCKQSIVVAYS